MSGCEAQGGLSEVSSIVRTMGDDDPYLRCCPIINTVNFQTPELKTRPQAMHNFFLRWSPDPHGHPRMVLLRRVRCCTGFNSLLVHYHRIPLISRPCLH